MIREFSEMAQANIRADMNNYADQMASGVCRDFAEYQKLVGVLHGLALAEEIIQALAKKVIHDDDDSDA